MVNYATAVPRFLWWGFKRAGWIERAIVVTGFLLLLGLVWPADKSDALLGSHGWANATQYYEFEGSGWNDLGSDRSSYQDAIEDAINTWDDVSEFDPAISSSERENDIHWGDRLSGWNGCHPPTGSNGVWAKECTKVANGHISESDIVFNKDQTWDTSRLEGIAAHEIGHSGGLAHDPANHAGCNLDFEDRWTMCPTTTAGEAWWATPQNRDITYMNVWY